MAGARSESADSVGSQQERPSVDGFVSWVRDQMPALDADKDGGLTQFEIQQGMQNPAIAAGNGAVYISALHDQSTPLSNAFARPEGGSKGFTLQTLEGLAQANAQRTLLLSANAEQLSLLHMKADITRIDSNHDGGVNRSELDRAAKREGWSPGQLERIQLASKHYDLLLRSGVSDDRWEELDDKERSRIIRDGITEDKLERYASPDAKALTRLENSIDWFSVRLHGVMEQPDKLLTQGQNNGCFFIAPLLQMQMRDPNAMKVLIRDNHDGTRTVTFPGDKDNPITVAAPTLAEIATYSDNRDAATVEKAFGIYWHRAESEEARSKGVTPPPEFPNPAHRLQFGQAQKALELLTGKGSIEISFEGKSEDEIHAFLSNATENGAPLIINSKDDRANTTWGITRRHSYAASYNPDTRTVSVVNPAWTGTQVSMEPANLDHTPVDGSKDNRFDISLFQLKERFFMAISTAAENAAKPN